MVDHELHTLIDGGSFFEGPRWHGDRWWVSDFFRHVVLSIDESGTDVAEVMQVPGQPSGLGWLPDGSMVVASMTDHRVLRRDADGTVTELADLSAHCGGPINDLVTDGAGHTFVGDFGFDVMAGESPTTTSLKRVDPDGTVTVATEGMHFPNGMVVTPDGLTLIVGESYAARYTAFTVRSDGTLTDRRVWAAGEFSPDGCTLDEDGHIWSADPRGYRCVLIQEGGEVVDEVTAPEGLNFFACALGGADGQTLLISAAPNFGDANGSGAGAAVLLTTRVAVPHAGWP